MNVILALLLGSLLSVTPEASPHRIDADAILGTWLTPDDNARVQIARCEEETFCGEIVWLRDGPPEGLGVRILEGFTYAGDERWEGGKINNPRDGNARDAELRLEGDDLLKVRVSAGLLRRTVEWTRVPDGQP
jgi:uncharacterized protein (DUF2147 family)